MIIWAGTSSEDVGMVIEHIPSILVPKKSQEVQVIPGRNGNIVIEDGSFDDYEQPYQVFLDAKELGGLNRVMPKLVDWLLGHQGYQRLEDTYFPDIYRMAYYSGGAEFINIFGEYGEGTLTFVCSPERFLKNGELPIDLSTLAAGERSFLLRNPTAFEATPLYQFKLSGTSGTIQVNGKGISISLSSSGSSRVFTIDAKRHQFSSSGTSYSSSLSGNYEDLALGKESVITWSSGVQNLQVIPRWWSI